MMAAPYLRLLCIGLAAAFVAPTYAGKFIDYGPIFANYEQRAADGGGCISGSIGTTIPGKNFNVIVTFASEANANSNAKRGYFGFTTLDKRTDVEVNSLRASIFRMCLKPGRYHLVGINAQNQHNASRVHIPFDVEAGKHFYLGSFIFHTSLTKPEHCSRIPHSLFVEVRDEHERDLPIVEKPGKAIGIQPTVRLIDPSSGAPYFVACGSSP